MRAMNNWPSSSIWSCETTLSRPGIGFSNSNMNCSTLSGGTLFSAHVKTQFRNRCRGNLIRSTVAYSASISAHRASAIPKMRRTTW